MNELQQARNAVREMGTHFGGRVNLELTVAPDGGSVEVVAQWRDLAALPHSITMRLRSGDGRPLRAAIVDGVATEVLPGDLIELPVSARSQRRVVGTFD